MTSPPVTASGLELPDDGPPRAISGVPAKPGWVVASMSTEAVIGGRGLRGAIVRIPGPGMAKTIAFVLQLPVCDATQLVVDEREERFPRSLFSRAPGLELGGDVRGLYHLRVSPGVAARDSTMAPIRRSGNSDLRYPVLVAHSLWYRRISRGNPDNTAKILTG